MPHYSWLPIFMREFKSLSLEQQQAFLDAVRRYLINPLLAGQQPPSTIFHKMTGYDIYEFRWDKSGRFRATCRLLNDTTGIIEIEWRRIGGHEIYQNPQYSKDVTNREMREQYNDDTNSRSNI